MGMRSVTIEPAGLLLPAAGVSDALIIVDVSAFVSRFRRPLMRVTDALCNACYASSSRQSGDRLG